MICVRIQLRYVFLRPYTSYGAPTTQGYHGVFQNIMGSRFRVRASGLRLLYIRFEAFVFGLGAFVSLLWSVRLCFGAFVSSLWSVLVLIWEGHPWLKQTHGL